MRLKITLKNDNLILPVNYQHILQGLIYNSFNENDYGTFIHDVGYRLNNKMFKFFVFSNLFGNYKVENNLIIFDGDFYFYLSSYYLDFLNNIYAYFMNNRNIKLNNNDVYVKKIEILDLDYFDGNQNVVLHTISPVVAYTTKDKYVTYYKPSDEEFEIFCLNNLYDKNKVLDRPIDIYFKKNKVLNEKKRLVSFKNNFYVSYLCDIEVNVNYQTLKLIYDTGLSSKGSAGFGMIEIK